MYAQLTREQQACMCLYALWYTAGSSSISKRLQELLAEYGSRACWMLNPLSVTRCGKRGKPGIILSCSTFGPSTKTSQLAKLVWQQHAPFNTAGSPVSAKAPSV